MQLISMFKRIHNVGKLLDEEKKQSKQKKRIILIQVELVKLPLYLLKRTETVHCFKPKKNYVS